MSSKKNFSRFNSKKVIGQSDLKGIELQTTNRCNLNCRYCGNEPTAMKEKNVEMSMDTIKKLVDDTGIEFLKISGGEVSLDLPRTYEIIKYAKSKDIITQINSNAVALNHDQIDRLEDAGLDILHISFNNLDADSFKKLRGGSENQFKNLLSNIEYAATTNMWIDAETIVTTWNCDQILDIHSWLADRNIDEHSIQSAVPTGNMSWDIIPTPSELEAILCNLLENRKPEIKTTLFCVYATRCSPYGSFYKHEGEDNLEFSPCQEGRGKLHVNLNGDILICDIGNLNFSLGNIYKDDIKEIHKNLPALLAFRNVADGNCKDSSENCFNKCYNMCYGIAFGFQGEDSRTWKQYEIHCERARKSGDGITYTKKWQEDLARRQNNFIKKHSR
jgi:MoaA/NifB/PqqE/SkfB family radical SAM enzyme